MPGADNSGLSEALIAALTTAGTERRLTTGDLLCREGDDSDEAYIVISGNLVALVAGHIGDMAVAEHGPGSLVGEVTTLIGGHRTATLRAASPVVVSVIDRTTLNTVFEDHPDAASTVLRRARERTDRTRVAALLSHELQAPDGDAVAAIAERVTWRSLPAGDVLFRRDDPADAAYLVVSGRLALTDVATSGTDDRTIEVGRGAIVGEFGLLESRGRSATITALRDSSLARLDASDFRALTVDHSALAMGLVRRILDRTGDADTGTSTARSFAIAITAPIEDGERATIIETMSAALAKCGPTRLLDPDNVDTTLRQTGIADTTIGSFGEVRLSELLHQSETESDHLMLDTGIRAGTRDDPQPNWTRRALHHADQIVIITSPNPTSDEHDQITRLLDIAPKRIPRWLAVQQHALCTRPRGGRDMRVRYGVDEIHHIHRGSTHDLGRLARLAAGRGVGLVLSGGGARGHAHMGVFRALHDQNVPVDRVVGASMGSIVAGMIGQDLDPDELLADMRNGADDLLDYTLPVVSLVKGDRIVKVLEDQLDGWEFDDLWIPFVCISTNMTTAELVQHREGDVARAIRSSISIPGVLPPVPDGDHLLADGGILDNLPVGILSADPSIGTIIASDVAPPLGPRAKGDYGLSVSGWAALGSKLVPKRFRRKASTPLPGVGATLMRAMLIGSSRSRDEHLASGAIDLYLELDLRNVSLLDFSQVDHAHDVGYESATPSVATWLAERGGSPWGATCS